MSLLALTAMAPFIVKSSGMGFAPVEWLRTEQCEVYDTSILVTRKYGTSNAVHYTFPYTIEGSIEEMISMASREVVMKQDNYLCDGPATTIEANYIVNGEEKVLTLYQTGGCGMPKTTRTGPYSSALMDIASTYCPATH